MFALIGISGLPLLVFIFALALLVVALVAYRRRQAALMAPGFEDTDKYVPIDDEYVPIDDDRHIRVGPHTLKSLQPTLAQILPGRSVEEELRLVTRWHWLSLLQPSERRQKRKLKPLKPVELLLGIVVLVLFISSISSGSITNLISIILLLIVIGCMMMLMKWLRWLYTYLVITDSLVAVIVSPPSSIFWINRKQYPFPVRRIENVTYSEIVAARQFLGAEVGNVHAQTLQQLDDDWILDMKMLPDPPTIYRVFHSVCPKMRNEM